MSYRGQRGGQRFFQSARITRGALYLLIAEVGLSLLYLISENELKYALGRWIMANAGQVWHDGKLWTLVTSPLMQDEFVALLFHGLILWMFVPVLERWWGTKKFLLFALWTSLAGTTVGTLAGLVLNDPSPIMGLDPFIYGCIVAYGILYAGHPVQFFGVLPMTGKQLMYGIIAVVALLVVLGGRWVEGAGYAAAMLLAWLLISGKWNPRLWYLRWKHKRLRRHLKVVRDDESPKKWVN